MVDRTLLDEQTQGRSAGARLPSGTQEAPIVARPVVSSVQDNETVRGQLRTLLSEGSPLLRQARDRSTRVAATRGLQNSSIAAQAGEEAFISQALPIAQQDAAIHSDRAVINTDNINRFGLQERGGEISSRLQAEGGEISSRLQREQGDISSRLQGEQGDIASRLQKEQGTISERLQALQGNINSRLQREQGDINSRLQSEQSKLRINEMTQEFQLNRILQQDSFQQQLALVAKDFANRMALTDRQAQIDIDKMNRAHAHTLAQINANSTAQNTINAADFARQLEASYLNAVSQRQFQASAEIQQIYSTEGLTSAQQAQAYQAAYSRMQHDISTIGAYYRSTTSWR